MLDKLPAAKKSNRSDEKRHGKARRTVDPYAAPYNGPAGPGNYSLQGSNYADCSLCLFVFAGCNDDYDCEEIYFADEGWMRIEAMAGPDEPFAATFTGVKSREVTIDEGSFESTPVPVGATWCVDSRTVT